MSVCTKYFWASMSHLYCVPLLPPLLHRAIISSCETVLERCLEMDCESMVADMLPMHCYLAHACPMVFYIHLVTKHFESSTIDSGCLAHLIN